MIIYTHPEPDKEIVEMKGPITEDVEVEVRRVHFSNGVSRRNNVHGIIIGFARENGPPHKNPIPLMPLFYQPRVRELLCWILFIEKYLLSLAYNHYEYLAVLFPI